VHAPQPSLVAGAQPPPAIPWDRWRELGIARAFRDTLVLSIREPTHFYGLVPDSTVGALVYGFVFELVVALASFLYHVLFGAAELDRTLGPFYPQLREVLPNAPELLQTLTSVSAIGSLVTAPFTYLFNLYTTAFLTWIGLRMARCLHTPFRRILQLFAYAGWIQSLGLLGVSGELVLSLFSFVAVLGLGSYYWLVIVRQSQGIDTNRAVISSLYGLLVAFVLGCVCGVPPVIAVIYLLISALSK
jgi:hypothetical protein